MRATGFFGGYAWLIIRNVLGWILILLALLVGPLFPGPGGIPLFLIGFALISFPGKRRLTTRVLRGRPIRLQTRRCNGILIAVAFVAAALTISFTRPWERWPLERTGAQLFIIIAMYAIGIAMVWLLLRLSLRATNVLLRFVPRIRRRLRPWLRRHHIRLLPPRWRHRLPHEHGRGPQRMSEEILKLGRPPRPPQ